MAGVGVLELVDDPQAVANRYLAGAELDGGEALAMVTSPFQFDAHRPYPAGLPKHGEHTEQALLALGRSCYEISALQERRAII